MGRVLTVEELSAAARELQAQGRTLAFANGHFDLLHVGHVRYLRASRAEADHLVVAVNDDASVRSLKGPGRPVVPAGERAELLRRSTRSTSWSSSRATLPPRCSP